MRYFSWIFFIPFSVCFRIDSTKFDFMKGEGRKFSESKKKINHLLFMDHLKLYGRNGKGLDSLVQTVCVFSKDIEMELGIEKCAMLVMEKGKIVKSVGIELPDGNVIKSLHEGGSYKYLGILEADKLLK